MQVESIMTGHLTFLSRADPNTPATLSHSILTDLLRKELGYQGLIVTDAMDMGGITVRYAPGEAAVRAVVAGADALLMPPVPDAAFEALQAAVKSDEFERASRCVGAANSSGESSAWPEQEQTRGCECDQSEIRQRCVAERSAGHSDRGVTLLRDTHTGLPLDGTRPSRALCWRFTPTRSHIGRRPGARIAFAI